MANTHSGLWVIIVSDNSASYSLISSDTHLVGAAPAELTTVLHEIALKSTSRKRGLSRWKRFRPTELLKKSSMPSLATYQSLGMKESQQERPISHKTSVQGSQYPGSQPAVPAPSSELPLHHLRRPSPPPGIPKLAQSSISNSDPEALAQTRAHMAGPMSDLTASRPPQTPYLKPVGLSRQPKQPGRASQLLQYHIGTEEDEEMFWRDSALSSIDYTVRSLPGE